MFGQEPLNKNDHPLASLYKHPLVILSPHLTFYTREAMERLETETLQRCTEILNGHMVTVKSDDKRLAGQDNRAIYPR